MLAIKEEELKMVNGGTVFGTVFGGSKFNVGDRVISQLDPDYGVGIIVAKQYYEGWWYSVAMSGRIINTSEDDLEFADVQ